MKKLIESFEKSLLKYGVAAMLIAIPLYPKFPLFSIPGSWVSVRLEDFLIAFLVLVWGFNVIRNRFEIFKDDLTKIIIIYLLIGFLSLVSAIFITNSVSVNIGLLHTLRRVEYLSVLFIMVASVKSSKEIIFYLQVIFLTLLMVFIYGVGQKFLAFPAVSTMNVEFAKGFSLQLQPDARISSTFAGHYDLAAYLVLILPLTISILVGAKNKFVKIIMFILFLLAFWLMLSSASRISFIAYIISITVTLWLLKRRLLIVPIVGLSILASLYSPQLTSRYGQGFQVALTKIKQIQFTLPWDKKPTLISFTPVTTPTPIPDIPGTLSPKKYRIIPTPTPTIVQTQKKEVFYGAGVEMPQTEDRSASIRFKVEWPRAMKALAKNPFLGTGYSSITLATDNDYLRALGEIGILGFLSFFLVLITIAQRFRKYISVNKEMTILRAAIIGIMGGALGFLGNATFIDVFEASKVAITFWLFIGLGLAIIKISAKERVNE